MANWKNVNNWHWTEKNCFKWAKGYFKEKFTQIEVSDKAGNTARISEVIECTGDVDLNQRKGKIITLFDLAFRLRFKGKTASGTDVKGIISIPEVMHDTEPDEYVFEISVDNQTKEMEPVKQLVREEMTKELRKCLGKFTADLIAAHSKDVYIPPEQLGTQAPTPAAAGVIPGANKAKNATSVTSQTSSTNSTYFSTTDIKVNTEFMASAADIYSALLDKAKVQLWTGGPAEIRPEVGSDFRLFNGNITGTIVELVENEKIVMSWRSASWPANHHSNVAITLTQGTSSTELRLTQRGVPLIDEEATRQNWQRYYWDGISRVFGYVILGVYVEEITTDDRSLDASTDQSLSDASVRAANRSIHRKGSSSSRRHRRRREAEAKHASRWMRHVGMTLAATAVVGVVVAWLMSEKSGRS